MLINLQNTLTQTPGIQQTYLAQAVSAGGTSSGVKNIAGFNTNWMAQIGQTGEAVSEILPVTPSGTQFNFGTSPSHTAGTLLFAHALDTPVYQIHYDQIILYRSTAGTAGPFGSLTAINIAPDQAQTQYDDTTGASTYAYISQYYNSVNGDLSGSSSIFVPGGPTFYSLQKLRDRVKAKLYSAGYIKDDTVINDWINEGIEDMSNAAIKVNQGYMLGTNTYGFGTAGFGTITDTAFIRPVKMEVSYDGGVTWLVSHEIPQFDFSELDYFSAFSPRHVWTGENTFEILPHNQAGSARCTYAVRFTPLVNDADELTQTLKAYTGAFVEYCQGVAYGLDQKDAEAQQHIQQYTQAKDNFIKQVTPRDLTGGQMISIAESVSALEDDINNEMGDQVW